MSNPLRPTCAAACKVCEPARNERQEVPFSKYNAVIQAVCPISCTRAAIRLSSAASSSADTTISAAATSASSYTLFPKFQSLFEGVNQRSVGIFLVKFHNCFNYLTWSAMTLPNMSKSNILMFAGTEIFISRNTVG